MTRNRDDLRFLLLQVRRADDPMRNQEVRCFARALQCAARQIQVFDLLSGVPRRRQLDEVDIVLLGGSGDYSVAAGGPWLPDALDAMRELCEQGRPTFASCWGFQAMSKALGGEVVTDVTRAEVGAVEVRLTAEGETDRLFGDLPITFYAQMGHQDIVDRLPAEAVLLASSERVTNQAYRIAGKPIYCTQFHPELNNRALQERVRTYPWYIEQIAGVPPEEFVRRFCRETPETDGLLGRFLELVTGCLR